MILIVDDKPENIFSLKKILEINGFEVDTAESGEEALKKILKSSYSVIILDVQMPGMDGFEVADAISGYSKAKNIPIIFLSAVNTDKKFIQRGYDTGGIDYITKPVDPDILILKVRTFQRLYEQTFQLNSMHNALQDEIAIRKDAQDKLNEKVEEQKTILESIPQIAFTTNSDCEIEYANQHWFLYSKSLDEFPETHPNDIPIEQVWQKLRGSKEPQTFELRLRNRESSNYRHYLMRMAPVIKDKVLVKWVGTITDIHAQKSANELLEQRVYERTRELETINKKLEESNHDLQQFASVASHDLKEPLRKIQIFSSIIKEKYQNDNASGALSYIDRIIDSSDRMSGLINDVLSYSRLSVSNEFKLTDINAIVSEILSDLEIVVKEKNAIINIDNIPLLEVIPGQIRQVFQNIISNALKFTRQGSQPIINIYSSIIEKNDVNALESPHGAYCRIEISDNGIGFDEKYLDKIFTIFQRLNAKDSYEGSGIGLAIAKKIIDKHNGLITAKSAENRGAKFIIVLPIQQVLTETIETANQ
jgi:signal transduction histidine kinase/DNA-binding response OmpR family regulator